MHKVHAITLAAVLLGSAPLPGHADWLLNAYGQSGRYQVFEFADDGLVKDLRPLPAPAGSQGIAWPSAIAIGSRRLAYASVLHGGQWKTIDRWTDTGTGWRHAGTALSANEAEPHGIGPAWVGHDAGGAEPWLMYYLVRGPQGPGHAIHRATSRDGASWTRRGPVFTSRDPLSLSTACRASDGRLVMVVHVYHRALATAASHLAVASTPAGPFAATTVAVRPDGWSARMSGRAGTALLVAPAGVRARMGVPLVSEKTGEVVVPSQQVGTQVHLQSPLLHDYDAAAFASIGRNKADISHLSEQPDGTWQAIMTGYGAVGAILDEYTTSLRAPRLEGPWRYAGDGLRFKPWFAEGLRSTENPHRFSAGIACSP